MGLAHLRLMLIEYGSPDAVDNMVNRDDNFVWRGFHDIAGQRDYPTYLDGLFWSDGHLWIYDNKGYEKHVDTGFSTAECATAGYPTEFATDKTEECDLGDIFAAKKTTNIASDGICCHGYQMLHNSNSCAMTNKFDATRSTARSMFGLEMRAASEYFHYRLARYVI